MGKASKWFRVIFGLSLSKKQSDPACDTSLSGPKPARKKPKKKWSFAKSSHNNNNNVTETSQYGGVRLAADVSDAFGDCSVDPDKHAIAVAAATAAVAEAAVAAAHAAAAVVKLTSSGRAATTGGGSYASREYWAAVKIQSHFRAYLSRRALRALKALVRLQALVRGHIARKQTAEDIRRMQAVLRVQARARAGRPHVFDSPLSASKYIHAGPPTPEKFEHVLLGRNLKYDASMMLKRNVSKSNGKVISDLARAHAREQEGYSTWSGLIDDKRSDKILEIDTGKPHIMPRRRNLFHSTHLSLGSEYYSHSFTTSKESTVHQSVHSPSSGEVQSSGPLKFIQDVDGCYCTADNSPQFYSASSKGGSSKRGPFTPNKSDGSRSFLSGYSDHPNYMSFTESSKAKMRSHSAPKQRPHQYERSSSTRRYLIHSFNDSGANQQRVSALHANFTNKAYPGSGRLDRLGMPVGGDAIGYSGGHWHRM